MGLNAYMAAGAVQDMYNAIMSSAAYPRPSPAPAAQPQLPPGFVVPPGYKLVPAPGLAPDVSGYPGSCPSINADQDRQEMGSVPSPDRKRPQSKAIDATT